MTGTDPIGWHPTFNESFSLWPLVCNSNHIVYNIIIIVNLRVINCWATMGPKQQQMTEGFIGGKNTTKLVFAAL